MKWQIAMTRRGHSGVRQISSNGRITKVLEWPPDGKLHPPEWDWLGANLSGTHRRRPEQCWRLGWGYPGWHLRRPHDARTPGNRGWHCGKIHPGGGRRDRDSCGRPAWCCPKRHCEWCIHHATWVQCRPCSASSQTVERPHASAWSPGRSWWSWRHTRPARDTAKTQFIQGNQWYEILQPNLPNVLNEFRSVALVFGLWGPPKDLAGCYSFIF